jgi:hypothetical protein
MKRKQNELEDKWQKMAQIEKVKKVDDDDMEQIKGRS